MKQKRLKNYVKFGILLFGISIILTNCQKDDDFESSNLSTSKPIPAVKTINFSEFLNQKASRLTVEKLNKLNKKSSKTSSTSNKDSNGQPQTITIDSTSIKQIIKDGTVSYTFKIVQDSINNTFFENLVIQTDSLQETSAYIIKYIPEADYNINNPFQGVREITPIDSNVNINTSNSKTTVCVTVVTYINHYLCDPGVEQTPENCDYQYTEEVYDTTCETIGGGGYGNTGTTYTMPSGTTSGGGGGGSSSSDPTDPSYDPTDPDIHGNGSNGPVLTSPNFDAADPDCTKLKNLISKSVTNQPPRKEVGTLLNQLQDSTSTTTKEMGFFLNPTDATESQFIPSYFEGEENADEVAMDLGTNAVSVLMHLHYNNETENKIQLSVFSLQDIYEMYQFIGTGHIFSPNTFTNFLTTEHGTNYAIQINDSNAFVNSSFAIKYFIGWEFGNIRDKAEDRYGKDLYNILPDKTNGQNELAFTKFLAKENLGLTLFRANDDFTEFTKIEYKNGTFTETPCN